MKSILTAAAIGLFALTSVANNPENAPKQGEAKVDTKSSTIYWTGEKVTGEHTGTLMIKEGSITMTDHIPTAATIVIDMNTIVCTDIEDAETNGKFVGHLNSPDFFSVKDFPTGTFVANKITPIKGAKGRDANYKLEGTLTLKGISEPLSFDAYIGNDNGLVMATGTLTFDRTKYGIRYGSGSFFDNLGDKAIYDDVKLRFVLNAE